MDQYQWAHKDEIGADVIIKWSNPLTTDTLYSEQMDAEDSPYFYAIIEKSNEKWTAYYIGMTYLQYVSDRNKAEDHQNRLLKLEAKYPDKLWHLTLGMVKLKSGNITEQLIGKIEGMMIYSHGQEELITKSMAKAYKSMNSMRIVNSGFIEPFFTEIVYGTFFRD